MSDAWKRAYGKGYNAGSRGAWPAHKPPVPPDEIIGPILRRCIALRDQVDASLATLCDDDDLVLEMSPLVDELDAALAGLGQWVRT